MRITAAHTLQDIERHAKHLIAKHLKQHWEFQWSDRMTNAFGYCHSDNVIKLSTRYTQLNKQFTHIWRDVVLHEIAHAMQMERQGYLSHDLDWKNNCLEIGAQPVRQFSRWNVTVPSSKYALRNAINGKVYQYLPKHPMCSIPEYAAQTVNDSNSPSEYELIWCGK